VLNPTLSGAEIILVYTAPEGWKDQARSTRGVIQRQKNAGHAAPALALPTHDRGKDSNRVYDSRSSLELHKVLTELGYSLKEMNEFRSKRVI
jgi:hypothetical protein